MMNDKKQNTGSTHNQPHQPAHRIRLPGFLVEEEIGLGDVVKKATYAMGIKPCGGCQQRADALNRWMSFSR